MTSASPLEIVDDPAVSPASLKAAILQSMRDGEWDRVLSPPTLAAAIDEQTAILLDLASRFPAGSVLERRGPRFQIRTTRPRRRKQAGDPPPAP